MGAGQEICPDGGKDENVFDIQQGVAIGIFVKGEGKTGTAKVHYADMWGLRENKYNTLSETSLIDTNWLELTPNSPFYLFIPQDQEFRLEYENGWKINEAFPINSVGIVTSRDDFVLDFDEVKLKSRIEDFRGIGMGDDEIRDRNKLKDNKGWNVTDARKEIRLDNDYKKAFIECSYRPFDIRPLFYHKSLIERSRSEVMRHMLAGKNYGIISTRQVTSLIFNHMICTDKITEYKLASHDRNSYLFPLYLYPTDGEMKFDAGHRRPNLNPDFVKAFSERLKLKFIEDGRGDLKETFGPEDIFNYAYAIFHSPTYRTRYAEFLKIDFPRLPLTSNKQLFKSLTERGTELVTLHLMEASVLNNPITKYPVAGSNIVEKVEFKEADQRVFINKEQYFEGVPPEVWNFHIGGYQVCNKWLKDRANDKRTLSYDDITHYQKIVVALKETIRLMGEIDQLIPNWPIE
jgi:predicted helicase